ncbi:hypothetical protein DW1_1132 [Proteiniborus sp. DW1]|uniref:hypothetical protein n=1 Tax=Proteiniborus sp. DW1 TaxID=1889883 RepID=UPI00092DF56E|nr:hypothetical protein [Proteiniborus sp. DW1]SCG82705.1 hypothetical protein DW1_1132 [Proteiniborus sp. DW1]
MLLHEIRRTIAKINSLESNRKVINSEIIEIELRSQREILNEQFKIAKAEGLKGQMQFLAIEGRR